MTATIGALTEPSTRRRRSPDVLVGLRPLARLALRRDRVRLPVWVTVLAVLPPLTASAFADLFPSGAARAAYAAGVAANPAVVSLQGPIFGTSLGALIAARTITISSVLVALLSVLAVARHTRAEEESGRRELLGSTVVGRSAPLAAALGVVAAVDLGLGAVIAVALSASGLPPAGSIATGAAMAAVGLVYASVAAVAAQLTESARAATGLGVAAIGTAFLLRAAGDAGAASWLAWLSPIGWAARVEPYTGERWWVLGLAMAAAALLGGAAFALSGRRDIGAGVLPPRLGPPVAPPTLTGPIALAWRLHRGALLAWTAGFALLGAAFGGIARGIGDLFTSSPEVSDLLRRLGGGGDLVDTFLAAELGILGLLASGYAVSAALRLRSEETVGRAEPVLATAVGCVRWAAGHLLFALLGPAMALVAAGLAGGLVHGLRSGDVAGQLPRVLGGALVQLPAVWVLAGIAVALFGLAARITVAAWGALVAFLFIGQFGPLLGLDQWALDLSPFSHLPQLPGGEATAAPLLWLAAVAAALIAAGLIGLRRRDIGS